VRNVDLPITNGDEACRVVRALGSHRYVAGATHLAHVFTINAAARDERFTHAELSLWAAETMADTAIDKSSRDERLYRRVTTVELSDLLATFWVAPLPDVRTTLAEQLETIGAVFPDAAPFEPSAEEEMFPLLIDAGWELLRYAELDPERHRGLVESFPEPILFESAKFEEACLPSPPTYLYEWPALGKRELLIEAGPGGTWNATPELWVDAPEPYIDYVLRGVLRAAKV